MYDPFYDPKKTYYENLEKGPFGVFSNKTVFERKLKPHKEFFGHKVFTKFGIPAGPVPNYNFTKAAFDKGFDIVVYKTVRTAFKATHDWPNVLPLEIKGDLTLELARNGVKSKKEFESPLSITNSFGVGSFDPEIWQEDIKKSVDYAKKGQILVGSFQGTDWERGEKPYINDHILAAKLMKETGVKVMEMNLSCPNEGKEELLCFDIEKVVEISSRIKDEIGNTPLILKMAYFEDNNRLRKFINSLAKIVDGFAAINTIPAKIIDNKGKQALTGKGREVSGVCGESIQWAGLSMVQRIAKMRKTGDYKFEIIGVGGVMNASDYKKYIDAGADTVMSATGAMWNPYLAQDIWNEYYI